MRAPRTAELWGEVGAVILAALGWMVVRSRAAWKRITRRMMKAGGTATVEELLSSEAAQEALANVLASAMASPAVKEVVLSIVHEITDPLIASQKELAQETGAWRKTADRFGASIDDHEKRITAIEANR